MKNDSIRAAASHAVFDIQEDSTAHNPYDQELREQESIRTGNIEALKLCWAESYSGTLGTLAQDALRSSKNIGIGVITLSSRSAIRGGVSPELAFSMADGFIRNIETITEIGAVYSAIHDAQLEFTKLVRSLGDNEEYNPLINRAKNYISIHMHEKITVAQMAKELGINADYLSALFSKTVHKTITQYILEERLLMCENMLKYSDYSIQDISSYFAFSSQSHFSKLFKRSRGITPAQYRKKYAREI